MAKNQVDYGKPLYREVLAWPIWLWGFILFMDASILIAIWAALSNFATWLSSLLLLLLTIYGWRASKLSIVVTQGWLIVGPAAIERAFIHNFKELDSLAMRAARGVGASPLDYFQIRFWAKSGVQMDLRDPRDKTTKWKVSSAKPSELVKALEKTTH